MLRAVAAFAGSAVCFTLGLSSVAARQEEPEFDGKKGAAWVDSLVNDSSARKRALAVEALARLWSEKRYKDSIPNIGRALRVDSSAAVRATAAQALGGLKQDDAAIAANDLIEAMGKEKESRVRRELAITIGRYSAVARNAVPQLIEVLKDPEPATRAAAAEALAQAGREAKSAAAGLAPLLQDKDKAVRRAAIIALGRITPEGASAVAETIAKMLPMEADLDMKFEIISSLGLLAEKSPVVVNALATLLTDPEDDLRRRAARTLGLFGTGALPAADALLRAADTDKVKDIRVDAVRAFGSALGSDLKRRVKDILALLKDPDFEVRLAVIEEVASLGYELNPTSEIMKAAGVGLSLAGSDLNSAEVMRILRKRLDDAHPDVRKAVTLAIRKIEKVPDPKDKKEPGKKEPDKKDLEEKKS